MSFENTTANSQPELSLVIPVYNGSATIRSVVERIKGVFASDSFEVVLVNDGSDDDSEVICTQLADASPVAVISVQLSRNFGEHNAVLAGLNYARGQHVAVLDDDGQNPPEEIVRMLAELKRGDYDVVYGHYIEKKHSGFRNLGSRFTNRIATLMLGKPKELYLSSFKVMNRFLVNEIIKYRGPFPYVDGLIYRTTRKIAQIPVEHRANLSGPSRYTFRKLVRLWLNMFLNFSITPLRLSVYAGLITACLSTLALLFVFIDKIWITPDVTVGIPTVLGTIVFLSGIQLMILGLFGEYLGRLYLDHTGTPQYVVRYVAGANSKSKSVLQAPSESDARLSSQPR
jgi:undecaprenyl-phosphate 4-deoxy-4-formamido-L-arabinose transferase